MALVCHETDPFLQLALLLWPNDFPLVRMTAQIRSPGCPRPPRNWKNAKSGEEKHMDKDQKEVAVLKTSAGEMVVGILAGRGAEDRGEFQEAGEAKASTMAPRFIASSGLHDPGRRSADQGSANEALWGTGGPGYNIQAEFNERPHVRGVLSMARSADPNSAGSQFFICLGVAKSLDRQYTAFGKLIKGDDVLEKIGDTPVGRGNGGEMSKPTSRVALESVKIVPADSVK